MTAKADRPQAAPQARMGFEACGMSNADDGNAAGRLFYLSKDPLEARVDIAGRHESFFFLNIMTVHPTYSM